MRTVLINVLILIGLFIIIDMLSMVILDIQTLTKKEKTTNEQRAALAHFEDPEWAVQHFNEFNSLETDYKSYYGWRRKDFKGETITIADGIRTTYPYQKVNNTDSIKTVLFLGGSTIWGTGVDDLHTIPSYFNKKNNSNYNSINLGESGYSAYQSLEYLRLQILNGLSPDFIISYDGVNNSPSNLPGPFHHARENQLKQILKGADRHQKVFHFMKYTRTLLAQFRQESPPAIKKPISSNRNISAATELLDSWSEMKKIANYQKAEFICILQPNIYAGNPDINNLKNIELRKLDYTYYRDVRILLQTEKYLHLENNFIDLTQAFDNMPNTYVDFCHVSSLGNEKIVDLLLEFINKYSWSF